MIHDHRLFLQILRDIYVPLQSCRDSGDTIVVSYIRFHNTAVFYAYLLQSKVKAKVLCFFFLTDY